MKSYSDIIKQHPQEVKEFLVKHLPNYKLPNNNENKILIDCIEENCDKGRHQLKAIINVDYGGLVYCYKCGHNETLYSYCKKINIHNELSELLSELSNISLSELKDTLLSNTNVKENIVPKKLSNEELKLESFRIENGMLPIDCISIAKNYALKRTFGNEELIKKWYTDNLYVYIPIELNSKIVGYVGRCYIDEIKVPRYNNKILDKDKVICYNYDNVRRNYNTNQVYLVEGIFDSIAIDHCYNMPCSIGLLGKSHYKDVVRRMFCDFGSDTEIILCLDSIDKDKNIVANNIAMAQYIQNHFFYNVKIVNLENGDPNSIVQQSYKNRHDRFELKRQLENNRYSVFDYNVRFGILSHYHAKPIAERKNIL